MQSPKAAMIEITPMNKNVLIGKFKTWPTPNKIRATRLVAIFCLIPCLTACIVLPTVDRSNAEAETCKTFTKKHGS